MKSSTFLIIISFIQLVLSSAQTNITEDDSYSVCPIKFLRRKRAHTEYTRWRANEMTTPEFILKIIDEDLTTPNAKQVVAINIQPIIKETEKIIVGGAIVPLHTTPLPPREESREYTRFVPPTTVAVTRVDGELYLAPAPLPTIVIDKISPIPPKGSLKNAPAMPQSNFGVVRNSQRDESPPASPQFLTRIPTMIARQYAPVAFTRRATISPLTPPPAERFMFYETIVQPIRSTSISNVMVPTNTPFNFIDFRKSNSLIDKITSEQNIATRSTLVENYIPERTSLKENVYSIDKESNYELTTNINNVKKVGGDLIEKDNFNNKIVEKELDSSYNMMFYNEEDKEGKNKKKEQDINENYDDKNKGQEENEIVEKEPESNRSLQISEVENETVVSPHVEDNQDGPENINKDVTKEKIEITNLDEVTEKPFQEKSRDKRIPICNMLKLRQLNFNSPLTLPEIVSQLKQWADESPVAKWIDITNGNFTTMENPIYMMLIDDPSSGQIISAKQTVMIVAGIQGRDHHAVAAAMYVLYQLIERNEAHADLLTKFRFWIIPVFNPDGYDYSMTFPHRREWSKNLRQTWDACKGRESCQACETYGLRCTIQPCYGVNLDRNFEYQWIPTEELRAEHPCGELFAGTRQLSEVETRALTSFLHEQHTPLASFIAFKEGDILGVMYPYSHTRKQRAFDHLYRQRAFHAASAAYSISGRLYVAGQTSEFLPLYAGGIEDWVDGHLGIDNTYTIMIFRPTDSYNSKLITERVVHEAYAAMDTLLLHTIDAVGTPKITLMSSRGTRTKHHAFVIHSFALLLLLFLGT